MYVSLQLSSLVALSAAILGRYSCPSPEQALPTTCLCRCDGSFTGPEQASLEKDLTTFGSRTYQPSLSLDTPVFGWIGGIVLGVIFTFALASCWNCFLVSLRNSLDSPPEYALRRPRALAP